MQFLTHLCLYFKSTLFCIVESSLKQKFTNLLSNIFRIIYKLINCYFLFLVCIQGYFERDGTCAQCSKDTFKDVNGDQNCTDCPSNYITQSTGAINVNMCGKMLSFSTCFVSFLIQEIPYWICLVPQIFLT